MSSRPTSSGRPQSAAAAASAPVVMTDSDYESSDDSASTPSDKRGTVNGRLDGGGDDSSSSSSSSDDSDGEEGAPSSRSSTRNSQRAARPASASSARRAAAAQAPFVVQRTDSEFTFEPTVTVAAAASLPPTPAAAVPLSASATTTANIFVPPPLADGDDDLDPAVACQICDDHEANTYCEECQLRLCYGSKSDGTTAGCVVDMHRNLERADHHRYQWNAQTGRGSLITFASTKATTPRSFGASPSKLAPLRQSNSKVDPPSSARMSEQPLPMSPKSLNSTNQPFASPSQAKPQSQPAAARVTSASTTPRSTIAAPTTPKSHTALSTAEIADLLRAEEHASQSTAPIPTRATASIASASVSAPAPASTTAIAATPAVATAAATTVATVSVAPPVSMTKRLSVAEIRDMLREEEIASLPIVPETTSTLPPASTALLAHITSDPAAWTSLQVASWLTLVSSSFFPLQARFLAHGVGGAMLLALTDAQLEYDLGVEDSTARQRILDGVARLRAQARKHVGSHASAGSSSAGDVIVGLHADAAAPCARELHLATQAALVARGFRPQDDALARDHAFESAHSRAVPYTRAQLFFMLAERNKLVAELHQENQQLREIVSKQKTTR